MFEFIAILAVALFVINLLKGEKRPSAKSDRENGIVEDTKMEDSGMTLYSSDDYDMKNDFMRD